MPNQIRVLMQYRPGYPQTSTAIQEEIWIDVSKRVDYQSLQWEQQATEQNTALRFDIFTMLNLSTTRYDDYASWGTSGNALDAYTDVSLGMVDAVNDPSFFIDIANRTEVKVQEWALVSGHYEVVRTLWGGVVSSVDTQREGDAFIVQRVECADFTALLDELIIRDYNAPTVSAVLGERPTISGLTTEVIAGGLTLTAGPYTFRVVAYNASDEIVEIFTHVSQNLTATDIDPPGISDPALRTIRLNWSTVAGATYYKVFAKSGIGVKDMYYKATVTSPTATYSLSTAPAVAGDLSPEDKVQKGSIDVDIISGSSDSEDANYRGIFNGLDPDLDPGIDNQTAYVETAKKLNDGTPDPEKSYRFSPTLETGIVLTSPFGGKTLKQALNIIIEKTGGVFWVDANKDLHYTNKQARELVDNPRFESSPASLGYSVAGGHSVLQDRGPYGYGRAIVAAAGATTAESKTSAIPVTGNQYYFARVKGWAKTNFASDWDAELRFYSDAGGTTQVGSSYNLERSISFDSTDDGRWCKAWALARAGATAVTARIVFMKKRNDGDEVAWTDFSVVKVTGSMGFSDSPSDTAYALPMKTFETPKAPRSASKVANRLLVYGVYKDASNPSELESVETDISLTLRKVAAGSLAAAKYYVRVVATVGATEIICKYATETITDQDVIDGNRELYASWSAVTGASGYKIYVGTKRFAMRLKATQAGTTLSIQSPAAGGAAISPEPSVYYYKVFDFAPGIWEAGGKIIEAAINDSLVDNDDKASTRALSFWEEKGIAERTWEFDTFETEVPMVGEVIPFVWAADDTAEPLMVKGVKAKLLGDRVYYTVTVGDDPLLTKRGVTQIFADMQAATARLNDTIAPEAPQSLAVTAPVGALLQTPDGVTRASVTAQWTPSPEDDFAHYSVEYGYDPNFTEVQRANVSQTSDSQSASTGVKANVVHTFQAEPGRTLYYRVAAIDNTNNKSPWSSEEIDLPQDETPCEPPYNALVSPGLKSNTVTWQFDFYSPDSPLLNAINTDFARFRVYRRVHNTGAYAAIAETSATQYVDTDFANYSAGYNYAVTSLDRTGNESGTPGSGGASGVAYNTTSSVPSKIDGGVDITTASISGAEIANATITDANIGSINADKITAGTLNVSTGMTIVSDGTAAAPQFEVDKDGVTIRDDSGNIVLQVNGATATLNADFIDVNGLTATEITVGAGEGVVRVGNYPNSTSPTFQGIWGGSSNPSSASFTLNTSGILTATSASISGSVSASSGAIGGWAIDSDKIYKATAVSPYITGIYTGTSASSGLTFFAGAATSTGTSAAFAVTNDGAVTATNANISGTISASAGTIGGFTIGADSLTAGSGATAVGISPASFPFFAGSSTASTAPFSVTSAGVLTATSASITGSVTANSGAIGGWSLSSTSLTGGDTTISSTGDITVGSGANIARISSSDPAYRLWLGGTTASTAPFRVTSTGSLVATSANVTGTITTSDITATGGTVGGWTLSSSSLTAGSGVNSVGINATGAGPTIFAGSSSGPAAPFQVSNNGAVQAKNITVLGGQVLIGEIGPEITEISLAATTGIVTVTTTAAYDTDKYSVGAKILIDVTGTYSSAAWANGYFIIASTGASTLTYQSEDLVSGPLSDASAGGFIYLGSQMAVGGDGGSAAAWMTVEGNKFALRNPADPLVTVIEATAGAVTINADFINAGSLNIGDLDANALTTTNFSVTNAGVVTAGTGNNVSVISPTDATYRLWIGHSTGAAAPFSVTSTGAISATSGSVGGWTLSSTSFTGGDTTISSAGDITLGTGSNVARLSSSDPAYRLWLGGSTASTAPFRVTSTGSLTATSANITGTISTGDITATGGTVGGWSLSSTSFTGGDTTIAATGDITLGTGSNIARLSSSDPAYRLWLGGSTASTAPFRVTSTGAVTATNANISGTVTATSGAIGGWVLSSTSLTGGDTTISSAGDITVGTGENIARISSSDPAYRLWLGGSTASTAPFRVTSTGALTATGVDIAGAVSASSGQIGGFTINSTSLTAGSGATAVGIIPASFPFFAGSSTASTAPFRVTSAGVLTATGADISGTISASSGSFTGSITATSGSIGGWSVDSERIYNALASSPYIAGVQGSSTSTGVAFFAGGTTSTGDTAAFKVTNDGALTATNATITGAVTATSGSFTGTISASAGQIGGWAIASDRITNLGATKYAGIIDTAEDNGLAFFAGATSTAGTGAVFSVTNEGVLTATSASVTGTISTSNITATGGFIGGWSLSSTSLTSSNTTISSTGDITLGEGSNVARLSSSDPVYRLWLGATTGSSAPFSVTSTGSISASAGTIGGFSLSSTALTAGTGSSAVGLLPGTFPFFAGSDTASSAPFRVTSAGSLTATDVTIVGTNETVISGGAVTGKLSLQPSASQAGSTILIDGTITFSGSLSASRPDNSRTVTVTGYSGTALVVGMFITTTCAAQPTLAVINAKILTVSGSTFTFESQSAEATIDAGSTSGTITAFTAYRSLQFLGGGITRFQQTASSPGAVATGSLIIGNQTGLNNIGTALLVIPADGELVFNSTVSNPAYDGGANLYSSNGTSTLNTSGNFTVGGTLTATTISATNYGLVAGDIPTLALGTDTSGNYVASVTSGNSLISVSGSGAEGAAVTITADTSPTFTGLITGSGGAEISGTIDLNSTISATSLSGTSSITNSQDVRIFFSTGGGLATWRVFRDTSSERYKTNIVYIGNSDSILDVQPVTYHDKVQFEEMGSESPRQYGFLAEDMAENIDGQSYVVYNEDGTPEAIQYSRLVVPLHSAMRKLRSRIDELEGRLAALENA